MAVRVVATSTAVQTGGTSITVPVPTVFSDPEGGPAALAAGDVLLVCHGDQTSAATSYDGNAAFTRLGPFVASSSEGRVIGIWGRRVTSPGSEPADYAFTRAGAGVSRSTAVMLVLRGADPTYLDTAVTSYPGTAITTGRRTESLTPAVGGLQVFFARSEFTDGNSHVPTGTPSGFAVVVSHQAGTGTSGSRSGSWVGTRTVPAGATGTSDIVWAAPASPSAQSVVIRAQTEEATARTAEGTLTLTGTATATARLLYTPQPWTVTDMDDWIAQGYPVSWAHRGGSATWSEMTMYAYDRAVAHGARALEVSVWRSSDGVWIMSHDANLSRVTGANLAIGSTPAAAMLGMPVTAPTSGGVIGRLEEVLTAYPDRVLLVDNKSGAAFSDFLDLLSTVPDATDHIVVKLWGLASVSQYQAAKARGLKTAGYWYPDSYAAELPSRVAWTDYIGMEYTATAADWAALAAYGKPLWGHVLWTQTQLAQCAAGGAAIFQLANVLDLMPRWNQLEARARIGLTGQAVGTVSGGVAVRTAAGTLTLAGTAEAQPSGGVHARTAAGTLTLAGTATAQADGGMHTRTAIGQLTLTGTAEATVVGGVAARTAVGVLTLDGQAAARSVQIRTALGSLALTGTADTAAVITRAAVGILILDGTATATPDGGTITRTAEGVLTVTGHANATAAGGTIVRTSVGLLLLAGIGTTTSGWRDITIRAIDRQPTIRAADRS
jgi:hypothetical protein